METFFYKEQKKRCFIFGKDKRMRIIGLMLNDSDRGGGIMVPREVVLPTYVELYQIILYLYFPF